MVSPGKFFLDEILWADRPAADRIAKLATLVDKYLIDGIRGYRRQSAEALSIIPRQLHGCCFILCRCMWVVFSGGSGIRADDVLRIRGLGFQPWHSLEGIKVFMIALLLSTDDPGGDVAAVDAVSVVAHQSSAVGWHVVAAWQPLVFSLLLLVSTEPSGQSIWNPEQRRWHEC